jgi:acetoacetyl-CoA synthetase
MTWTIAAGAHTTERALHCKESAVLKQPVQEGELLWTPSAEFAEQSNMAAYMRWLAEYRQLNFSTYDDLWQWSCSNLEEFWLSINEYFGAGLDNFDVVLSERRMPGAKWFHGATVNFAEQVFRNETSDRPALVFKSEVSYIREVSWDSLRRGSAQIAALLRNLGIQPGDSVAGYMPNIPETAMCFLACASVGGVWSSCSPDFGTNAVVDRFGQIEPKVLFAVDGYTYGGKAFDRRTALREILDRLPSVQTVVFLPYLDPGATLDDPRAVPMGEVLTGPAAELRFDRVPFDHPLWVLYSSGTTGLPKGIVHGQGGVVLELFKWLGLHTDLKPSDRFFWHTSTGWMMWNALVSGLLTGATLVMYDGNPAYPGPDVLWKLAQDAGITVFGTSAPFIMACQKAGIRPGEKFDLHQLRAIGSTGAPLPVPGFQWVYEDVKADVWLASVSGGTDVATAFVAGCPLLPVRAGEIQCRSLGCKVESFDEAGRPGLDRLGELVVTEPMPSMPIYMWADPEGIRYHDSYFDVYPGIWRHGDWIRIKPDGGCVIEGRSDATLNRMGVRLGSSEIYAVVEGIPEIVDSLIIGVEQPNGGYYLPMFVVLAASQVLDDALKTKIKNTIRSTLSPRHVPDDVIAVPSIPRTLSGKKMEIPVKRLFQGVPLSSAAQLGATNDASALEYFERLARGSTG